MEDLRFAIVGIGATGTVLAAALLSRYPKTLLVGSRPETGADLLENGIKVSGVLSYEKEISNYVHRISYMKDFNPQVVFISTKTFHLDTILDELQEIAEPGTKFISTHNGLGPEDDIAELFGPETSFRMSLNYGVSLINPGRAEVTFFNKPNYLGALSEENRSLGLKIADVLTDSGLETVFVDNIKLFVWRKMIMKCTLASICAVTDRTIKEVLEFPPTREIAEGCFREALAVAKAKGYDLGEDYMQQAMSYLDKVGMHKDSMCYDIDNKKPTEIDFLGGKIVEYGRQNGIPTPFYITMTNLVKTMEAGYLNA